MDEGKVVFEERVTAFVPKLKSSSAKKSRLTTACGASAGGQYGAEQRACSCVPPRGLAGCDSPAHARPAQACPTADSETDAKANDKAVRSR